MPEVDQVGVQADAAFVQRVLQDYGDLEDRRHLIAGGDDRKAEALRRIQQGYIQTARHARRRLDDPGQPS
ncbi:hypothetical protein [Fodinicola acaciae]|uniref:hypothetical protein n=1 Tax=Fodinicola acaciae TaxID=2681555 RepID=UPI0013D72E47|nr:hypothetical protein [Fodinicola acaciae]